MPYDLLVPEPILLMFGDPRKRMEADAIHAVPAFIEPKKAGSPRDQNCIPNCLIQLTFCVSRNVEIPKFIPSASDHGEHRRG